MMDWSWIGKAFGFIVLLLIVWTCRTLPEESRKDHHPNILMIHVDDLGYHDLSYTGSEIYQTPNIDALALQSIVFKKAYANYPRCVPSRYAMMTGSYPLVNGEVPDDGYRIRSIPDQKNMVKMMNEVGYQTAYFGKWHLGDGESSPRSFGFAHSFAAGKPGSPISYHFPFNTPRGGNRNVKKAPMPDVELISKPGDYLTDILTDQVIQYTETLDKNQPFLTVLAYYAVHQPLEAKKDDVKRNQKEIEAHDFGSLPEYMSEGTGRTKMRQDNPDYAAMVENLDWNIGKLLQRLENAGLLENTIIVFSSDHGGLSNDGTRERRLATSNYPLRAGKGWQYEGGIKVPLFISWKDHYQPRVEEESIVTLMDLFPTYVELVKGTTVEGVDGKSLLPIIENREIWDERTVYWHTTRARPHATGETNSSAIRSGKWKLIDFYEDQKIELYDLDEDPYERSNLAVKYPQKVAILKQKLNDWKE